MRHISESLYGRNETQLPLAAVFRRAQTAIDRLFEEGENAPSQFFHSSIRAVQT